MDSVNLTFTKKGLMIFAVIVSILDIISTWAVAKADISVFLNNEINKMILFGFSQIGWGFFIIYPIVPILFYYSLFTLAFWMEGHFQARGQSIKEAFYFLISALLFHLWVIAGNLIMYIQIVNFK